MMLLVLVLVLVLLVEIQGYCRIVNNKYKGLQQHNDNNNNNVEPITIRSSISKPVALGLGYLTIVGGVLGSNVLTTNIARARTGGKYPIIGDESIMSAKAHGTSILPVQDKLRWKCDTKVADRICNYNRNYAEYAGYWNSETNFLKENDGSIPIVFYDSVTGVPLFKAPIGRTWEEFVNESKGHGWPSFRDDEVVWDNVRSLRDGEMVSTTGTHLGHNLPDRNGNRYCINLVSVAGYSKEKNA